ncbi:MAG: hypothetical protein PVF58_02595 [Candidatus Methanofastidiosia archaeon]|jgi:hypothetical protein
MTFTVDACIVISAVNKFDFFHKRSKKLLERREDDMILLLSVMNEAIQTFVRKFNQVSSKILLICRTSLNSPDFFEVFKKNFDKLVKNESQKRKNLVNFYKYIFQLIEPFIKNKNFIEMNNFLQDYALELSIKIPERINSVKKITEIIISEEKMKEKREKIKQIISQMRFSKDLDKIHFIALCIYSIDKKIDYFTTDKNYFLLMTESLNLIKNNEFFNNIGLFPRFLTRKYINNL